MFVAAMSYWMKKSCGWFPKYWHSVICWHGMWMMADPLITLIMDGSIELYSRYYFGEPVQFLDYFALPDYFRRNAYYGNPGIGIYLTFFEFLVINLANVWVFYRYMVFYFKDGRILDLYRRLSGEYNLFFIPADREVSLNYLRWVLTRAKSKNISIDRTWLSKGPNKCRETQGKITKTTSCNVRSATGRNNFDPPHKQNQRQSAGTKT